MKIFIAQQNYHIGNFDKNVDKIIKAIEVAKQANADLIVFSEMSICGYPSKDFLDFRDFIDKCFESIEKIKKVADTIAVIIGAPDRNPVKEGKDLFNAAFFIYQNEVKSIAHKTCLPTYDVFDENRYFEPAFTWNVIEFKQKRIALTVCEDIWNLGDNPLYRICPMDILMEQKPDVMINISASPFDYTHADDRRATIKANVLKYKIPLIYCNAVGSQTEIIFDGVSLCFDKNANLCHELSQFNEEIKEVILLDDGTFETSIIRAADEVVDFLSEPERFMPELNISQVYDAIILGIKDYFSKMGFTKAIIGSSGGIDSAVTIALACEALGNENVRAVLMPSEFSTTHSVSDAEQLSKNLGNPYDIIPIKKIFDSFITELHPVFKDLPFGIAEENIQSRTRG
ncbi:MAG TPA: NAD(+) synthase, partial [Hanamia sp.]|nr:NAD(+) synthase [Hanamia sp.]